MDCWRDEAWKRPPGERRNPEICTPLCIGIVQFLEPSGGHGAKLLGGLPEVPTFEKRGLAKFQYDAWFAILAPAAIPTAGGACIIAPTANRGAGT
jgi:hypothetical protein